MFFVIVENFIALFVSRLLSFTGLAATSHSCFIYVPSLNHTFIVTLSCVDWVGILLQAFIYTFVMWIYVSVSGSFFKIRNYFTLLFTGFIVFFLSNILRMFAEIYLLGKVYSSVYHYYLLNWGAFEEQIGLILMFVTLSSLSLLSYLFIKNRTKMFNTLSYWSSNLRI